MHELARARLDRAPLFRCRPSALPGLAFGLAAALLALTLPASQAAAQGALPMQATRTLGMGSASRGHATGTAALSLNPSGISLARSYVVEGGYQFLRGRDGHVAGVAIADSTSGFNMGGGLYYTYGTASPEGAASFGRHEAGAALSFPFGDKVMIGGALRYLRLHREALGTVPGDKQNGFTFDAGMTIRPVRFISVGVAGRGLRDMEDPQVPFTLGAGLALLPTPEVVVVADVVKVDGGAAADQYVYSGGAEYTFASLLAVRLGGGRATGGGTGENFGSLGFSWVSEVGALDVGGQMALSGRGSSVYFGLSGRLFVPTP